MNTAEKIIYYTQTQWCIPFRELHHSVCEVCELVKPISPGIEPNKYIEYFLANIDFDNIDKNPPKAEGLKNCKTIYFGLDQLLKHDIDNAISEFQKGISKLKTFEFMQLHKRISEFHGLIKRESRNNIPGISFAERFNLLYKEIGAKDTLVALDYQILIRHFNETILNDLVSSYEIILETFATPVKININFPFETRIAFHNASKQIKDLEVIYERELKSLKAHLENKGYILPKNFSDFIFWLLIDKYKQETFFPLPEISDKDFVEYSKFRESKLESIGKQESTQANQKQKPSVNAPTIACFCNLVNESQLMDRGVTESIESYCKRVCAQYNLLYTDNVRKNYLGAATGRNKQKVESRILNTIPVVDKEKILPYINNATKIYN